MTSFTVNATYTGSTSAPVYPHVDYDGTVLMLDGPIVQSGNNFTLQFKSRDGLSANSHKSTVVFSLCRDSGCATTYPGSVKSFDYVLDVKIDDWTTRQRNAAHNGYVHTVLDSTKFAKAWEYTPANSTGFEEMAAQSGTVYLAQHLSDGSSIAMALNGSTGVETWRYSLGNVNSTSGPALSGGRVMFSTMFVSSGTNPFVILDAATGQFVRNLTFAAQWSNFAQPTPYQDAAYIASGYYGNVVYAFDIKNVASLWTAQGSKGNTWDGEAPAVDGNYLYYYSGNLDVFDRRTGALVKSITDPFWQWNGYSYGGTPMIGSDNSVIAYSGNGQGTYSVSFPLVSYDINAGAYRWRTASGYTVIPAVANGVVYAATNQSLELDAIDEATGSVKWAWPLPAGETFSGNIVVTDTLVFVSTNKAIYAVDLTGTHQTKWSAATPGWAMITPDAKLVVASPRSTAPARITAYSLQ